MSGHGTLAKNMPKSDALSPRACGTGNFSGPGWIAYSDGNERLRIMEAIPLLEGQLT